MTRRTPSNSPRIYFQLMKRLEALTKQNVLHWQSPTNSFSIHIFETFYKGAWFNFEKIDDNSPNLFIDGHFITSDFALLNLAILIEKQRMSPNTYNKLNPLIDYPERNQLVKDTLKKLKT